MAKHEAQVQSSRSNTDLEMPRACFRAASTGYDLLATVVHLSYSAEVS
jgi:hypothetical protein